MTYGLVMDLNLPSPAPEKVSWGTAAEYRNRHGKNLMTLVKLRSDSPSLSELGRILSVETTEPNLWVTVRFLDGTTRGMRPGAIRRATQSEEQTVESGSPM